MTHTPGDLLCECEFQVENMISCYMNLRKTRLLKYVDFPLRCK